ncbi:coenzyme F420-0:L-glutamate ligase [Allofustis seminis]|uniref:coenzyme F420-0:L-glutamate ligase n=1 Tax=Allofustis seminis TaxID=166939 RepID=UPI00036BA6FC|nr:coenzyme F420-0:L-glutamate ligase [Allofustis seminis]
MARAVGTVVRGLRAPIIKKGDDIVEIVTKTLIDAAQSEQYPIKDRDIIALTESIVARAAGSYVAIDDIAMDAHNKFDQEKPLGILFPIFSRNRFMNLLKGFARGSKKIVLQLSYPTDEVGNALVTEQELLTSGVNPWSDVLTESDFYKIFGSTSHRFTGVDYIALYRKIVTEQDCECEIIFSNNPTSILEYTDQVLTCDIHSREHTKATLKEAGAKTVLDLSDMMNQPVNGSAYNEEFGLLGANNASTESIKLFPSNSQEVVEAIQKRVFELTGKKIEAMVYGDGAFKDPVGEIWELADPIVSPGYTDGLKGTPNEVKLKYLADNEFSNLSGDALKEAIADKIHGKENQEADAEAALGTTPRQLTDLLGSLADLTSGSGDKGTPFVYIQGYFDDYTSE